MQWDEIKNLSNLDPNYIHLACSLLSSHPKPIAEAIDYHRRELDKNPALHYQQREIYLDKVLQKAAEYLETSSDQIALTESTTMGLALVFGGLKLKKGEEILTTEHEHYALLETLRFKAMGTGCHVRKIRLYENPISVTEEELINTILKSITLYTRILALTWVHSSTGVKLPIEKIGHRIQEMNRHRRIPILLSIDGVHALGVEEFKIEDLCCDFFISGCHKWLFGPRGTGLVWGSTQGWENLLPIIPSFDMNVFSTWRSGKDPESICSKARLCTPGGFTAYEHRWGLCEAFELQLKIGKKQIQRHIHELAGYAKEKLKAIKTIQLYTPSCSSLSAGLICFESSQKSPAELVQAMQKEKIMMGQTPYYQSLARWSTGCFNHFQEIDRASEILTYLLK